MKTIYILMEDADMTTWSHPSPTGQVVYSEEEAKKWVAEADEQIQNGVRDGLMN
jgi:hypothetical protein